MALWKILMPDNLILVVNKVIMEIQGLMGIQAMAIMVITDTMAIMERVVTEPLILMFIIIRRKNMILWLLMEHGMVDM